MSLKLALKKVVCTQVLRVGEYNNKLYACPDSRPLITVMDSHPDDGVSH